MGAIRSVLFVCTGNSCRSVMAEGLLRARLRGLGAGDIQVSSAGTGAFNGLPSTPETVEVMAEIGIDVAGHRTKNVSVDAIKKADLILTMEDMHKSEILRVVAGAAQKTFLLKEYGSRVPAGPEGHGVHDPIGQPVAQYRICRDEIKKEIDRIAPQIIG